MTSNCARCAGPTRAAWRAVRSANIAWLTPWEATHPDAAAAPPPTFGQMVRSFSREARAGRMLPFAVLLDGALVGQLTVSGIAWGSLRSAHAGYWVDRRVAGRGVIPTALALAVDHCFFTRGPAPDRDQHPAGERREPAGRSQTGLPARGPAPPLPPH